jgi:hypothetical protein
MLLSNITGVSEAGVVIVGDENFPIDSVVLSNIHLRLEKLTDFPGGYRDLRPGTGQLETAAPGALYARNIRELAISVRSPFLELLHILFLLSRFVYSSIFNLNVLNRAETPVDIILVLRK